MSPLPDDRTELEPGEAYQTCIRELHNGRPDYERAQVYATLALEESARAVVAQLEELGGLISRGLRRL
jgi:hypothetical protein